MSFKPRQVQRRQGEGELAAKKRVVILVEDDPSVLRALRRLIASNGYDVRAFARPSSMLELDTKILDSNACLIFDVHLPEMTGVDLYERLVAAGCRLPVIVITGHVDQRTSTLSSASMPSGSLSNRLPVIFC